MNAKRKRSRKRSAASSKQPKKSTEHIFFIDEALGVHVVSDALKNAGESVEIHSDIFESGVGDEEWIKYVGKHNRLAITKDKRIRHRQTEISTIKKHKAKIFRFASGNLSGAEMAKIIVDAREKIKKYADVHEGPFIVSITRSGKINPIDI